MAARPARDDRPPRLAGRRRSRGRRPGTVVNSVSSKTAMIERTSSVGEGFSGRSGAVRQKRVDLLEHPPPHGAGLCALRCGVVVLVSSSRYGARSRTRPGAAPRWGCAVNTGWNRRLCSRCTALSSPISDARRAKAVRDGRGCVSRGGSAVAFALRPHRWCSSARLARVEVDREGARHLVGARDRDGVGDRGCPREGLGRLVRVGLDRRDPQALDVLEETRRTALAQGPGRAVRRAGARRHASSRASPGSPRSARRGRWLPWGWAHAWVPPYCAGVTAMSHRRACAPG